MTTKITHWWQMLECPTCRGMCRQTLIECPTCGNRGEIPITNFPLGTKVDPKIRRRNTRIMGIEALALTQIRPPQPKQKDSNHDRRNN